MRISGTLEELNKNLRAHAVSPRTNCESGVIQTRDLIDDRESQAAAVSRRVRHAIEPLPHVLAFALRNAGTGILHREKRLAIACSRAHGDVASRRGVLEGVVDEIT